MRNNGIVRVIKLKEIFPQQRFVLSNRSLLLGFAISLCVLSSIYAQEQTISEVRASLDAAKVEGTDVYSAGFYQQALKYFQEAEADSTAGKNPQHIQQKLAISLSHLENAQKVTERVKKSFPELVQAHQDALKADSPQLAAETMKKGIASLEKIIARAEKGDWEKATELIKPVVALFRAAELEAIKLNIWGDTQELLSQATTAGGVVLTPQLMGMAKEKIQTVEKLVESDRYNLDSARVLIEQSNYLIQHALVLIERITELKDDPGGWEKLILQLETYVQEISNTLDLNPDLNQNLLIAVEAINTSIRNLQENQRYLQNELAKRDNRIGELEAEMVRFRSQTSKYTAELEEKRKQIQEQKRFEEKIRSITSILSPQEGTIIRSTAGGKDEIIIRLTGLSFRSGFAEIQPEGHSILKKVEQVIQAFPDRTIEIHGHTDSQGKAEVNLALSQARAQAVKNFFLSKLNLESERVTAVGFGEEQPIATNDTEAGRKQNRRIEIILK